MQWTKEKFDAASFSELIQYAELNWDDFWTHQLLIECLVDEVRAERWLTVKHIIEGIENEESSYYVYDPSMGTLDTVCGIRTKEDLLDFFEEREFDRVIF